LIFILGGDGFVGSGFVRACERSGLAYTVIDRTSYAGLIGERCDVFINANGNSSKLLASNNPLADFDASVRSVRQSLADFRYGLYVYLSSCDVYPDCSDPAATREGAAIDAGRQSPYGFHKSLAEACVSHAAQDWMIVRCGGFVGPGLRKNPIFDILHGGPLWLDPRSELQFLHTDGHASLVLALAERAPHNGVYNLCGRGVIRLSEVIEETRSEVPVKAGSPFLRYDVSIEKVSRWVEIPETRDTVLAFVQSFFRNQGGSV
jgi:nucleoside-diphosphate-sugar epimerase